jgi:hypothetical protein
MTKKKALVLAFLTAWPYLFLFFSWLVDRSGLIDPASPAAMTGFILYLVTLILTGLLVPSLVIFYLVYLLTRPDLPLDRKLIWSALLVIGHIFTMPIFWVLFIWKPRQYAPLDPATRFSLLLFAPLMLLLLLPLFYLLPMLLFEALFLLTDPALVDLSGSARLLLWVFIPALVALIIFMLGRQNYRRLHPPVLSRRAWLLLWAEFSLLSLPVAWFDTLILRGLLPTDAPPNTPAGLLIPALLLALLAQPLVIGWLFLVSRLLPKIEINNSGQSLSQITSPASQE